QVLVFSNWYPVLEGTLSKDRWRIYNIPSNKKNYDLVRMGLDEIINKNNIDPDSIDFIGSESDNDDNGIASFNKEKFIIKDEQQPFIKKKASMPIKKMIEDPPIWD